MSGHSLKKSVSWTFLGFSVWSGTNFVMSAALAHLAGKTEVGYYFLALAFAQPWISLGAMNLRSLFATDSKGEYEFEDYVSLRFLGMGMAAVLTLGVALFSDSAGNKTTVVAATMAYLFGAGMDQIIDMYYGVSQRMNRMDRVGISMMIRGVLSLILFIVFQLTFHSVVWAFIGSGLASVAMFLFWDFPRCAKVNEDGSSSLVVPTFRWKPMWTLAKVAVPIGTAIFLASIAPNLVRVKLSELPGGLSLVATFGAYALLINAGRMVITATGLAVQSRLGDAWAAGNRPGFMSVLRQSLILTLGVGLALPIFGFLFGKPVMSLLFKPEYAAHNDVLVLILLTAPLLFVSSLLGSSITACRYIGIQFWWFMTVVAVSIPATYYLVPKYGLYGAAYASLVIAVTQVGIGIALQLYALTKFPAPSELRIEPSGQEVAQTA